MSLKSKYGKIEKKLKGFNFLPIWALLAACGLIFAAIGTSYTNYTSLSSKFPSFICIGVSIAITLGFLMPLFLRSIPLIMRCIIVMIMFISTSLAINTMASKEITNSEERLKQDEKYRALKLDWMLKNQQYNELQRNNTANAQAGFLYGAKEARIQRDLLKSQVDEAYKKMISRADTLGVKGSIQSEAYVETWYTLSHNMNIPILKNFDRAGLKVTSDLIFSLINDTLIPIFAYILVSILGSAIIIENKKSIGLFHRIKMYFSGNPQNIKSTGKADLFNGNSTKRKRKDSPGRPISGDTINGINAICRIAEENDEINLVEIGIIAAKEVGRDKPFGRSYVSKVLRKYGKGKK